MSDIRSHLLETDSAQNSSLSPKRPGYSNVNLLLSALDANRETTTKAELIMAISSNPLNAEFNPICNLLALLGPQHILHVRRIRVN
jgi:hypothetical protein